MLIRELIPIPEQVGAQDFVLKLTEGVGAGAARALEEYVLTDALVRRFDEALDLVQATLGISREPAGGWHQGPHQKGRAIYLHGSFGSGKSHFMAVLDQVLNGEPKAWGRAELGPVIQKHGEWLRGKKFLRVPYHMLGADSLEERVYEGYLRAVREKHPEAALPALYVSDGLLQSAIIARQKMGDGPFFAMLSAGAEAEAGWGQLSSEWNRERFEAALQRPSGDGERELLAERYRQAFGLSGQEAGKPVEFALGLERLSQHAAGLGYQALVLFLDELILWLAGRASTPGFIEAQVDKLVNLVESNRMQRPIPLIGFIARQRDLRELIQRSALGSEQVDIEDKLAHHQGRFAEIRLETRDLPEIAQKRLLKPKDPAAKLAIDQAFEGLRRGNDELFKLLLGAHYKLEDFRRVYPFSPVLVDTLVRASSMLQRDRTALRAMLQLLVRRRDDLELGEIIPVGDLYDVISSGSEALSGAFSQAFGRARTLYEQKLVPLLVRQHGLTREELLKLSPEDKRRVAWRGDDRVLKTLVLAALVSGVPALEHLDARRIAHLNHGSFKVAIPNTEHTQVLKKLRQWAAEVPEIRLLGDDQNPEIGLELHGVDLEGILQRAGEHDNHGNRMRLLQGLLLEELGLEADQAEPLVVHEWRGVKRRIEVRVQNVRTLPLDALAASEEDWRILLDYPTDDLPDGAERDASKLREFKQSGRAARVLVWLPRFFNHQGRQEIGRLVVINRVLASEQSLENYSEHLSSADRAQARNLLKGQRETLKRNLVGHLRAAFGLSNDSASLRVLDEAMVLEQQLVSLEPSFEPRSPGTGSLRQGLLDLCEQVLAQRYPKAPLWPRLPSKRDLARVFELAMEAALDPRRRRGLDSQDQKLMRDFAVPLELGQVEAAFVLGDVWEKHFATEARRRGGGSLSVGDLWEFIDRPRPRGLPAEARDLLVRVYAALANLALLRRGEALDNRPDSRLGDLEPGDELRPVALPEEGAWKRAVEAAQRAFGLNAGLYRNAAAVIALGSGLIKTAEGARLAVQELEGELERVPADYRRPDSPRRRELGATLNLLRALKGQEPLEAVRLLAGSELPEGVSFEAIGSTWRSAAAVREALRAMNWGLIDVVGLQAEDVRLGPAAAAILERLRAGLAAGQLAQPLEGVLRRATAEATEFLKATRPAAGAVAAAPSTSAGQGGSASAPEAGSRAAAGDAGDLSNAGSGTSVGALPGALGVNSGATAAAAGGPLASGQAPAANAAGSANPAPAARAPSAGSRRLATAAELARLAEELRSLLEQNGALRVEWRLEDPR